jgi:hypothetical protein
LKDIKLVLEVAATKVRDQRFALDILAEGEDHLEDFIEYYVLDVSLIQ